jgi:hypothetical protein
MHSVIHNLPVHVGFTISNKLNVYAGFIHETSLNSELGYRVVQYKIPGVNYLFGVK